MDSISCKNKKKKQLRDEVKISSLNDKGNNDMRLHFFLLQDPQSFLFHRILCWSLSHFIHLVLVFPKFSLQFLNLLLNIICPAIHLKFAIICSFVQSRKHESSTKLTSINTSRALYLKNLHC